MRSGNNNQKLNSDINILNQSNYRIEYFYILSRLSTNFANNKKRELINPNSEKIKGNYSRMLKSNLSNFFELQKENSNNNNSKEINNDLKFEDMLITSFFSEKNKFDKRFYLKGKLILGYFPSINNNNNPINNPYNEFKDNLAAEFDYCRKNRESELNYGSIHENKNYNYGNFFKEKILDFFNSETSDSTLLILSGDGCQGDFYLETEKETFKLNYFEVYEIWMRRQNKKKNKYLIIIIDCNDSGFWVFQNKINFHFTDDVRIYVQASTPAEPLGSYTNFAFRLPEIGSLLLWNLFQYNLIFLEENKNKNYKNLQSASDKNNYEDEFIKEFKKKSMLSNIDKNQNELKMINENSTNNNSNSLAEYVNESDSSEIQFEISRSKSNTIDRDYNSNFNITIKEEFSPEIISFDFQQLNKKINEKKQLASQNPLTKSNSNNKIKKQTSFTQSQQLFFKNEIENNKTNYISFMGFYHKIEKIFNFKIFFESYEKMKIKISLEIKESYENPNKLLIGEAKTMNDKTNETEIEGNCLVYTLEEGVDDDNELYLGEFSADEKNGKGFFYSCLGDLYKGEFINGSFDGLGILHVETKKAYVKEKLQKVKAKILSKINHKIKQNDLSNSSNELTLFKKYSQIFNIKNSEESLFSQKANTNHSSNLKSSTKKTIKNTNLFSEEEKDFDKKRQETNTNEAETEENYTYLGYFRDNYFEGFGIKNNNEGLYIGSFEDGVKKGFGIYFDTLGNIYFGELAEDDFNGIGVYLLVNGDVYEGNFRNGVREGYGIYRSSHADWIYKGEFKSNYRDGFGEIYVRLDNKFTSPFEYLEKNAYYRNMNIYENQNSFNNDNYGNYKSKSDCKDFSIENLFSVKKYISIPNENLNEKDFNTTIKNPQNNSNIHNEIESTKNFLEKLNSESIYTESLMKKLSNFDYINFIVPIIIDLKSDFSKFQENNLTNLNYEQLFIKHKKYILSNKLFCNYNNLDAQIANKILTILQNFFFSKNFIFYSYEEFKLFIEQVPEIYKKISLSILKIYFSQRLAIHFQFIQKTNLQLLSVSNFSNKNTQKAFDFLYFRGFLEKDKFTGEGLILHLNKTFYKGGFVKGLKSGFGLLLSSSCDTYKGNFSKDKKNGFGKMLYFDGEEYEGSWENDLKSGLGVLKHKNSDVYKGAFFLDKKHGKGVYYVSENQERLEGEWQYGVMDGPGKIYVKEKLIYEGFFYNNLEKFKGHYLNKDFVYEGEMLNRLFHGKGILISNRTCDLYEGEFEYGRKSGFGVYNSKQFSYTGSFKDDLFEGIGELCDNINQVNYKGEFEKGLMEGKGKLRYSDGTVYDGSFRSNEKNGEGVYIWPDGRKVKGIWRNDEKIA